MKGWLLVTTLLAALSMGMAFCHLLEMSARMSDDPALWLKLLQTLYGTFGTTGVAIEVGAMVTVVVAAFLVPRGAALAWILTAALCLVLAHLTWWIAVAPVNAMMAALTPESLPAGWMRLRNQWEYSHAARAVLEIVALAALVLSLLVDGGRPSRA